MPIKLRLSLIIVSLILLLVVIVILKKDRIPIKYALVWVFASLIIMLVGIIPGIFEWVSSLIGFMTISNMITGIFLFILLLICISLTIMISSQKNKITLLIQEISILKEKVNMDKKNG